MQLSDGMLICLRIGPEKQELNYSLVRTVDPASFSAAAGVCSLDSGGQLRPQTLNMGIIFDVQLEA